MKIDVSDIMDETSKRMI